jgi:DNA-binding MarR family transcriptional regulator|tara:strand:+ start:1018 stop:1371 length:354 start_codon:yes stop_codon:yes gene_type:complete
MNNSRILKGLQDSIKNVHRKTGDLTITQLNVLLFIMRRGSVTGMEICQGLEMSRPTVSRIIALLSEEVQTRKSQEPLGLIRFDDEGGSLVKDRRVKYVVLTEKGEALANSFVEAFAE